MSSGLKAACDAILQRVVSGSAPVPGVVAMATDRRGNVYEGAAGKRVLGQDAAMTTDTVFAIFSTTKAITGTAALQLVEEGRLDLDAPAKTYVPEIGELQVLDGFEADGKPRLRAPKRDVDLSGISCVGGHDRSEGAPRCRDAKSPGSLTRSSTSCWREPIRRRPSTRTACSTG